MSGDCLQCHDDGRSVHAHVLSHIQMDVQGISEQFESGGGLRLDLIGQLSLIVEIATSLDGLPREIIAISEKI